jgi:hypothetical protein
MPGAPRRRPYPCDINLNGYGLMLGASAQGAPLVATRPPTQDEVAPTDFGYGAQSPKYERIASWRKMTAGYGLKTQKTFTDNRYYYGIRADLSCSGEYWLKGPDIGTYSPTNHPGEVIKFFELGGVLFALNGQYIQKVTLTGGFPTAWTTVATLSAPATDVVTFGQNGFAAIWAYIAMGDSLDIYKFDGTTATQHNEGTSHIYANKFCVIGNDLYRSQAINQLSKVSVNADPYLWASWGADNQFYCGDRRYPITGMAVSAIGDLLIFKTNAVYSLAEDGSDIEYFPQIGLDGSTDNGRWPMLYGKGVHVTYGGSHYILGTNSFGTQLTLETDGPEKFIENDSVVRGRITAFTGVGSLFGIGALWDADSTSTTNGRAHLMKYGAYEADPKSGSEEAALTPAWHGSISQTFAVKITSLYVTSIGAPAGHTMTYLGFADGTYGWLRNPCVPNPAGCSSYLYTTAQAEVYLPNWHGGFFADTKTLRSISVSGLGLSPAGNNVQIEYKLDPSTTSWTGFGTVFQNSPLQKANFLANYATKLAAIRVLLMSVTNTSSPQVTGVALHHNVHPDLVQIYEFHPLAVNGLLKRDGSKLRLSANRIRQIVEEAVRTDGAVPVILADESIQTLTVVGYSQGIAWNERLKSWQDALTVQAMQFTAQSNYGTYGRMEPYLYSELELRTYGGLEQL